MAKYKITLPNGDTNEAKDFNEAMGYMEKYVGQAGFKCEEIVAPVKKNKAEEQEELKKRNAFYASLTDEQRKDVGSGKRQVRRNTEGEYYIRFTEEQQPMHNSLTMLAKKRKATLRSLIKKSILDNCLRISDGVFDEQEEFSTDEILAEIKNITFIDRK